MREEAKIFFSSFIVALGVAAIVGFAPSPNMESPQNSVVRASLESQKGSSTRHLSSLMPEEVKKKIEFSKSVQEDARQKYAHLN